MAKRESILETRINKAVKKLGGYTIKVDASLYDGFPDRIVFLPHIGEIHYIELKNNTYYERTQNQKTWEKVVRKSEGIYFLLNGDKEVEEYLEKIGSGMVD